MGKLLLSRFGVVGMMCRPLLIYKMDFASSYYLIPIHFLNSAIMDGYYNMHLFPVSASSISLHRCHCICILSCGCVGLLVRRYCCEFLVCCHWKSVIEFYIALWLYGPLFLAFIFRLGSLNFFSTSFLLQLLFYRFIPIWNLFVSVAILIGFCSSEWYNGLCESWAGVRWHD